MNPHLPYTCILAKWVPTWGEEDAASYSPKPKTTRVLDVVGEVTRWTNTWDGNNPDHFKCPFGKCERTYETASECADHVHQEKHKSAWSTFIKKHTSSNSLPVFSRILSWIVFICLKNCLFWEILNLNLAFAENVTPKISPFRYCVSRAKDIKNKTWQACHYCQRS